MPVIDPARTVAERCVALEPRHARCLTTLGTTMLRQADEAAGLDVLRRAFTADPYNVRTYNQLELFEKTIPDKYTLVETAHFRFRIEPALRTVLEQVIAPFLEQTYAYYRERYQIEPALPGFDAAHESEGRIDVARPDARGKTIDRVVRDRDRLIDSVERNDGSHRAEDLLARNRHVVAHAGE